MEHPPGDEGDLLKKMGSPPREERDLPVPWESVGPTVRTGPRLSGFGCWF